MSGEDKSRESGANAGKAAKTVGAVMVIMFIGKATGLVRDMLLRRAYGTEGIEAKALSLATNVPRNFLDFAFASVIAASFVPVFNTYLEREGREDAFRLADSFVTVILLATGLFTALGMAFAGPVAAFFAPGYPAEALAMSVKLLRVMMLTVLISGAAFSLTGVVQSLGEFNIPAAMSVASNLLIIAYLLFFTDRLGVYGLAAAFLLGWLTQALILIPPLIKRGYIYKPRFQLKSHGMREIYRLMPSALVGSWLVPVNTLVNQRSASAMFEGAGAAVVDTANQLYSVITGVFILSVSNVVFPRLAKQRAQGDERGFSDTLRETIHALLFVLMPMMFGLAALSLPLTRLLFEGGRFDELAARRTAEALFCYAPGMLGFGLQTVLSRAFFAQGDGKTPMLTGLLAMALNAFLSSPPFAFMGIAGPPLGSSISITLTGFIMLAVMNKREHNAIAGRALLGLAKTAVCGGIMGLIVHGLSVRIEYAGGGRLLTVILPTLAGIVVYISLTYIIKLDEARLAVGAAARFAGRFIRRRR